MYFVYPTDLAKMPKKKSKRGSNFTHVKKGICKGNRGLPRKGSSRANRDLAVRNYLAKKLLQSKQNSGDVSDLILGVQALRAFAPEVVFTFFNDPYKVGTKTIECLPQQANLWNDNVCTAVYASTLKPERAYEWLCLKYKLSEIPPNDWAYMYRTMEDYAQRWVGALDIGGLVLEADLRPEDLRWDEESWNQKRITHRYRIHGRQMFPRCAQLKKGKNWPQGNVPWVIRKDSTLRHHFVTADVVRSMVKK